MKGKCNKVLSTSITVPMALAAWVSLELRRENNGWRTVRERFLASRK
jgi:hypothetical protein